MIAYFVHDDSTDRDVIFLPDAGCSVPVTRDDMSRFISARPSFATWTGNACVDLAPEDFGTVVATRDEADDVCIIDPDLWRARMARYLDAPA